MFGAQRLMAGIDVFEKAAQLDIVEFLVLQAGERLADRGNGGAENFTQIVERLDPAGTLVKRLRSDSLLPPTLTPISAQLSEVECSATAESRSWFELAVPVTGRADARSKNLESIRIPHSQHAT